MDVKLGQLTTNTKKDAVHVAILPVVAGETLNPGDKICFHSGLAHKATTNYEGVVDPFLQSSVTIGQQFYMCMVPGTIQNLRHEWDHPSLPVNEEAYDKTLEESEKEKVLRAFAEEKGLTYRELMRIDDELEELREVDDKYDSCRGC